MRGILSISILCLRLIRLGTQCLRFIRLGILCLRPIRTYVAHPYASFPTPGYPQPEYRWLKDAAFLSGSFSPENFYRIPSVGREDAGDYQCMARNSVGTIVSEKIPVKVACEDMAVKSLPDGTLKLAGATNSRKKIVTFYYVVYSNDMFHYMFKAEFVALVKVEKSRRVTILYRMGIFKVKQTQK